MKAIPGSFHNFTIKKKVRRCNLWSNLVVALSCTIPHGYTQMGLSQIGANRDNTYRPVTALFCDNQTWRNITSLIKNRNG